MQRIRIPTPSRHYEVCIGRGLLDRCGSLLAEVQAPCRVCIVSDDGVWPLYGGRVFASLEAAGFSVCSWVFPRGEASKTPATLLALINNLSQQPLTRRDCLVALGGGVVGDLTGFAAAVYLRGIPFVQIPTSLLAMVDSSVGGKTAVDLPAGKNLMGAFHQPSLVICDPLVLDSLSPQQFADGCGEVIKYGVIGNRPFFDSLSTPIREQAEDVIAACVAAKRDIVANDERDAGQRQLLNLGHTVGHGIEKLADFTIPHGHAVAMGMAVITRAAVRRGLCPPEDLNALLEMLRSYDLPAECPFPAAELEAAMAADKKRAGDRITLVVPHGIGDSRLLQIPMTELSAWLADGLEV